MCQLTLRFRKRKDSSVLWVDGVVVTVLGRWVIWPGKFTATYGIRLAFFLFFSFFLSMFRRVMDGLRAVPGATRWDGYYASGKGFGVMKIYVGGLARHGLLLYPRMKRKGIERLAPDSLPIYLPPVYVLWVDPTIRKTVMRQDQLTYQPPILAAGSPLTGSCRLTTQTYVDGVGWRGSGWTLLGLDEVGMMLLRCWGVWCGELGIDGESMRGDEGTTIPNPVLVRRRKILVLICVAYYKRRRL